MTTNEIYNQVVIELGYFKFHRNCLAYEYLIDAIIFVYKDKKYLRNFKKLLYVEIANKYNTKPENILWSISKLLKMMYLNTDESIIKKYFKLYYYERPSVKAFIMYVSKRVEQKLLDKNTEQKKLTKIS